jgi:hypothetical protein
MPKNPNPSLPKFSIGYNAGHRHVMLGKAEDPEFTFLDKSEEYLAGYAFGAADQKAGIISDKETCERLIRKGWQVFLSGGVIPKAKLPASAGKVILTSDVPGLLP